MGGSACVGGGAVAVDDHCWIGDHPDCGGAPLCDVCGWFACPRSSLGGLVALVVAAGVLVVAPGSAVAAGSGYFVTFVARSCPSYSDVFANRARNDIQESLVDLGPDSPYNSNGESLVDPRVEGKRACRTRAVRCLTGSSRSVMGLSRAR